MAGKIRHFVERDGRYFARLVVPKHLRIAVGKTELRIALGGDYRQALKVLPSAVTSLQLQIFDVERKQLNGAPRSVAPRYPMTIDELTVSHYVQRLAFDDELRNNRQYTVGGVDDHIAHQLRLAMGGKLSDIELAILIGARVERFREAGNLTAVPGSDEWRQIARALCVAEYEALCRVVERDEGEFAGKPTHPQLVDANLPENKIEPVNLQKLADEYVISRTAAGFMKDRGKRLFSIIDNLRAFLKHNDARKISKKDLTAWRESLKGSFSAKTISDVYLSNIRSLFKWAVDNDRLPENVAKDVRQEKPRTVYGRERGYTDEEATVLLKASRNYQPAQDEFGRVRETPQLIAAKRWVPILCAFTGARVSEVTQLRAQDLRREGDRLVIRITPDAGTVKAGGYRDVPLHRQIEECGFEDFVKAIGQGPLFHNGTNPARYEAKSKRMSNQLAEWISKSGLKPEGMQPNHGWRHRLKTQALELGINSRVIDGIQGHAGRTAGENYGDVTLNAKAKAIDLLPVYAF